MLLPQLYGYTRSWAKELGGQGIRVIGVAPGVRRRLLTPSSPLPPTTPTIQPSKLSSPPISFSHGFSTFSAPQILEATGLRTPEYERSLAEARHMSVDDLRKTYSRGIPLGREAKLSEVASVIAFLVRPAAQPPFGFESDVTMSL